MYLFPKDPKFRKIWTLRLKRDGFEPSEYSKLCERHFEKDQFAINPDVAYNVKFHLKSKMLKPGAVPSVFDYTDPKKKKPESSLSVSPVLDGNQETSASEINTNTTIPQQDFDDDVDEVKANVECYSTMSQTTYDLIKRRHVKLQTEITVSSPPDVKMVSTGTQTDESYLQDSEDLENSFMKSMEEEDGHDDDIDSEWIPESDDDEQCNDYEEINHAKL
uniref:THAP domain-containing protein 3-like n=1 Tax=Crassostrea virginica TaxID=6565 RepID=A0A8B8B4J4_CRAVI|nr:THAP domain-containing protein 3-like [Crassostrea virginica]